jgi:hypothetical protein
MNTRTDRPMGRENERGREPGKGAVVRGGNADGRPPEP